MKCYHAKNPCAFPFPDPWGYWLMLTDKIKRCENKQRGHEQGAELGRICCEQDLWDRSPGNAAGWSPTAGALQIFQGLIIACCPILRFVWGPACSTPALGFLHPRDMESPQIRGQILPGVGGRNSIPPGHRDSLGYHIPLGRECCLISCQDCIPSQGIASLPRILHPKSTTTLLGIAVTPDIASPQALLSPGPSHPLSPTPGTAVPGSPPNISSSFPSLGISHPVDIASCPGYCISPHARNRIPLWAPNSTPSLLPRDLYSRVFPSLLLSPPARYCTPHPSRYSMPPGISSSRESHHPRGQ